MPHMANLPWISFYFLIALFLSFFWVKENFSTTLAFQKLQNSKITQIPIKWMW